MNGRVRRLLRSRSHRALCAAAAVVTPPVKVNLGAGGVLLPGWLNTDRRLRGCFSLNIAKPWQLRNVDYVFADNVVEHLTLDDARAFFVHAHDAMREGGVLRLTVPDVEANARAYLDGGSIADSIVARHEREGYSISHQQDLLRVVFVLNDHASGYQWDYPSLALELAHAGFANVQRCEAGRSEHECLTGLEARAGDADRAMQLTVEATRITER